MSPDSFHCNLGRSIGPSTRIEHVASEWALTLASYAMVEVARRSRYPVYCSQLYTLLK